MDVGAYLRRIGYQGERQATTAVLRQLHHAHMTAVPFENLDIPLGQPIMLTLPALYDKIVVRRRGGFCYELNALFGWLLQELGFVVDMLAARVYGSDGPGPPFDHMLLQVTGEGLWLVDVGFGDSFIEPIQLREGVQEQAGRRYRLVPEDSAWRLDHLATEGNWQAQYAFTRQPRQLVEYEPMCHYQQTSPQSSFTRRTVCTRATATGRITLANDRLIVTNGGERQETVVAGPDVYRSLLQHHFGVRLADGASLAKLLWPQAVGEQDRRHSTS